MSRIRLLAASLTVSAALLMGGVATAVPASATTYTCGNQGSHYTGTAITSYGDTGNRVIEVQCLLKAGGYLSAGQVDGIFGSQTQTAVRSFQSAYHRWCDSGLAVDGIVGPYTWGALRSNCPS
jgi:peptidoglycan hydrolase-like protein with peptidoglycan-binding domain